jgi:hypothetical protein
MSDDEYGEEGFDDYEEEFEEADEAPAPAKQKQAPAPAPASSSSYKPPRASDVGADGKISSFELSRRRQRAKDLRGMVSLSPESQELLSLTKLSPYVLARVMLPCVATDSAASMWPAPPPNRRSLSSRPRPLRTCVPQRLSYWAFVFTSLLRARLLMVLRPRHDHNAADDDGDE